jgi:regulator of protease activity HflC (stomatin/prohibitin superfamily)
LIIALVIVAVLVLIGLAMVVRLVWQYEKGVPFRLGRPGSALKTLRLKGCRSAALGIP